jgi:hypothetical protein
MSKKISCGGFYIDENDFNIDEEGKLSLNAGGGSQEPLVLTAVSGSTFVRGTVTGATPEEIKDAWVSGRPIRINLATETITMVESFVNENYFDLSAYFLFSNDFCKGIIHVLDMTYELKMYTLTPA